jgi:hypothetical protein
MKLVLIDPEAEIVISKNVVSGFSDLLGSKPSVSAKFPNGDRLISASEERAAKGFSIGGSPVIAGLGLVVGHKDDVGDYTRPRSDAETIAKLVRWVPLARPVPTEEDGGHPLSAVIIDPEICVIAQVYLQPDLAAIDRAIGGRSRFVMKVTKTDAVFVRLESDVRGWCWRKDGLVFSGRSLVVGCDADGTLTDVTTDLEALRDSVEFKSPRAPDWQRLPPRL